MENNMARYPKNSKFFEFHPPINMYHTTYVPCIPSSHVLMKDVASNRCPKGVNAMQATSVFQTEAGKSILLIGVFT